MTMDKKHLSVNSLSYQSNEETEEDNNNSCKNSLFFGLFDDSESRSGIMKRQYSDMGDNYHRVYEEESDDHDGSKMDMRVLMVLEFMRELYVGQLQLLKKMFPGGAKDEFLGFFNKIGDAMSQFKQDTHPPTPTKSMTMQRSLSTGSPRVRLRGLNLGPSDLKDERFKVTTVDAGTGPTGGTTSTAGGTTSTAGGASGAGGGGKGGSTKK